MRLGQSPCRDSPPVLESSSEKSALPPAAVPCAKDTATAAGAFSETDVRCVLFLAVVVMTIYSCEHLAWSLAHVCACLWRICMVWPCGVAELGADPRGLAPVPTAVGQQGVMVPGVLGACGLHLHSWRPRVLCVASGLQKSLSVLMRTGVSSPRAGVGLSVCLFVLTCRAASLLWVWSCLGSACCRHVLPGCGTLDFFFLMAPFDEETFTALFSFLGCK